MTVLEDYCNAFDSLSQDNQERLPVVEWLLSPKDRDRRSGRSTLMAMAFVRGCAHSRRPVKVFDHHSSDRDAVQMMSRVIRGVFRGGVDVGEDGMLRVADSESEIYYSSSQVVYSGEAVAQLLDDFRAVVRTLIRSGMDVNDLASIVRGCLAQEVMET